MEKNIRFQRLMAEADIACGLGRQFVPRQQNSQAIDELISKRRNQLADSDSASTAAGCFSYKNERNDAKKLRSLVLHVDPMTSDNEDEDYDRSKVFKRLKKGHSNTPFMSIIDCITKSWQPTLSWDDEVRAMMIPTSKETHNFESIEETDEVTSQKTPAMKIEDKSLMSEIHFFALPPKLPDNFVPMSCFYSDMIDTDNTVDELARIIPNMEESSLDTTNLTEAVANEEDIIPTESTIEPTVEPTTAENEVPPEVTTTEELQPTKTNISTSITGNKNLTTTEKKTMLAKKKQIRLEGVTLAAQAVKTLGQVFGSKNALKEDFSSGKRRGRSIVASLRHANIAATHRNTKPDLREIELKYYHRPHILSDVNAIVITVQQDPATKSNKDRNTQDERQNISLQEGNIVLFEYIEEFPPILSNVGMASAILNYQKEAKVQEEHDDDEGNPFSVDEDGLKSQNKSKMWSLIQTTRLPRHLLLILKQNENKNFPFDISRSLQSNSKSKGSCIGEYMPISSEEESPFLGEIPAGTNQLGIVNNLFKAPIFPQNKTISFDFLLVPVTDRNNKVSLTSSRELKYILRPIPQGQVFTVGQMEPQREVPYPIPEITETQSKFYLLAAVRYLSLDSTMHGIEHSRLHNMILKYCAKDLRSPHKNQHRDKLKLIISKVATESDGKWFATDFHKMETNIDGNRSAVEIEREHSEEELAKRFTPEDVCLTESSNAAEYRLRESGITHNIDLSAVDEWIKRLQRMVALKDDQYIALKKEKAILIKSTSMRSEILHNIDRLLKIQWNQMKKLRIDLMIGEYIYRQLVKAPWNTTSAFYSCVVQRDNKQTLMDITSPDCDPSGCGEGYSYVRNVGDTIKPRTNERLQGTDADLRKRTLPELITMLTKLGVDEKQLKGLQRWDMVHLVRELMNFSSIGGSVPDALKRFVRTDGAYGAVLQQDVFKQKCQDIWKKQIQSLQYDEEEIEKMALEEAILQDDDDEDNDDDMNLEKVSDNEDIEYIMLRSISSRENAMITLKSDESKTTINSNKGGLSKTEQREDVHLEKFLQDLNATSTSKSNTVANVPVARVRFEGVDGANISSSKISSQGEDIQTDITESESDSRNNNRKPVKIVKKVTKTYIEEGNTWKEQVKVEFIVSPLVINRVEDATNKERKRREMKRRNPHLIFRHLERRHGSMDEDIEEDDMPFVTSSGTLGLKLDDLRRRASEATGADAMYDDEYKVSARSKKRSKIDRNCRLPRVELAARFEDDILSLWHKPKSAVFHFPVSRDVVGYYDVIKNPISLMDIREKIAEYKYSTAKALLDDVQLMAENAEKFNGLNSDISKRANSLVHQLKESLNHDRIHFGAEGDTIKILEEAIQKKDTLRKVSGRPSILSNKISKAPIQSERLSELAIPPTIEPSKIAKSSNEDNVITNATTTDIAQISASLPSQTVKPNDPTPKLPVAAAQPVVSTQKTTMFDDDSSGDEEVIEDGNRL